MGNGNQLKVSYTETMPGEVELELELFRLNGSSDPIVSGHLTICISDASECEVPALVDVDMDGLDDEWEEDNLIGTIEMNFPTDNPDLDDFNHALEFAFKTNPLIAGEPEVPTLTFDKTNHPLITYDRFPSSPRAFHYDLEYSYDGIIWERAALFDYTSELVTDKVTRVTGRSWMKTADSTRMLYRLRVAPR